MLSKTFRRLHLETLFSYFHLKKRVCISYKWRDSLHEMSNTIFWGKWKQNVSTVCLESAKRLNLRHPVWLILKCPYFCTLQDSFGIYFIFQKSLGFNLQPLEEIFSLVMTSLTPGVACQSYLALHTLFTHIENYNKAQEESRPSGSRFEETYRRFSEVFEPYDFQIFLFC